MGRRAEQAGFSTLGTLDRLVYPNYEPLVALAAAAAVTERIGLLTAVLLAPLPPERGAGRQAGRHASTSSRGGRLTLGVGLGSRDDDYEASGMSDDAGAAGASTRCSTGSSACWAARRSASRAASGRT